MLLRLHSKSNSRKFYSAPLLSLQSLVALCFLIAAVIVPYVLVYKSDGFYLKHNDYREQPKVSMQYKYILEISGTNTSTPFSINSSNDTTLVFAATSTPRTPTIKVLIINRPLNMMSSKMGFMIVYSLI